MAIHIGRGVVQQANSEAVIDHRDFIFLLLQDLQENHHLSLTKPHVTDSDADLAVLQIGVEAFLVLGLILCGCCVLPNALFHRPGF